ALYFDGLAIFHTCRNGEADAVAIDGEHAFFGSVNIGEIELQCGAHILTSEGCRASATSRASTSKHRFEEIRETTVSKVLTGKSSVASKILLLVLALRLLLALRLFVGFAMLPVFTVFVILFTVVWVRQYFVGFIDLLEFLFGFLVIGVDVGMVFAGELAIGFFDLGFCGIF